jgi:hypothetical protein
MSENIGEIRLQIIKSMLAEFPELKVQIRKEIHIQPLNSNMDKKIFLRDNLASVAYNSKNHFSKKAGDNERTTPVPLWAKLALATSKKEKNGRYYVFK